MKGKPDIHKFLSGGAAAAAEKNEPAQPAPLTKEKDVVDAQGDEKITKTIRMSKSMERRLKETAFKLSMAVGKRMTESDLIEAALNNYLCK